MRGEITYVNHALLLGSTVEDLNGRTVQDALRAFFRPIKNEDSRLDFYTSYKKKATKTSTLPRFLYGLLNSPTYNQTWDWTRTNNLQSSVLYSSPSTTPTYQTKTPLFLLPTGGGPPGEIVSATGLMYMGLLVPLLAMLEKQAQPVHSKRGRSMIERCSDRQRKFDELKKWSFYMKK